MSNLGDRRTYIGASDVGSILGLNKWHLPEQVWLYKVGQAEAPEMNEAMRAGHLLEPLILDMIHERIDLDIYGQQYEFNGTKHGAPWARCHVDGLAGKYSVDGMEYPEFLIEAKNSRYGDDFGDEYTDDVPTQYYLQAQFSMHLCGAKQTYLGVLIGGNEFRLYIIPYKKDIAEKVLAKVSDFWDLVKNEIMPEPTSGDGAAELYPIDSGDSIKVNPEVFEAYEELKQLKLELKEMQKREKALKDKIQIHMCDCAILEDPNGNKLATWKTSKPRKTFDKKAFQADHPELSEKYTKESKGVRTFLIK